MEKDKKENNNESLNKKKTELNNDIDVFNELLRRVDITRRSRVKASSRLRAKHEFYDKVSYFYSLLILIFSIYFIEKTDNVPKVLLIASLALTFFTMFLGSKNYKERASNFETNYQQLNVLLNKMQRMSAHKEEINQTKIKELHRDYEKLIMDKENHLNIDYITHDSNFEKKYKNKILRHNIFEWIKRILVAILPLLILVYFIYKSNKQ